MSEAGTKLVEYWRSLKGSRRAPLRSEIDPRDFAELLDHFFILEVRSADDIRFRIAGIGFCEIAGFELRGTTPEAIFEKGDATNKLGKTLHQVINGCAGVELHLSARDEYGNPCRCRMVLLPLETELGGIDRIMGCLEITSGRPITPLKFQVISSRVHAGAGESAMEFAESQAKFTIVEGGSDPAPHNNYGKRPVLKVVSDQDEEET